MKQMLLAPAILALAACSAASASASAPIVGRWSNPKHNIVVAIAPCGASYCGRVVWASDKEKTKVPGLVGTELLRSLHRDGGGSYSGTAFDPNLNVQAPATVRLLGADTLQVNGCAAAMLCKEQDWTRTR